VSTRARIQTSCSSVVVKIAGTAFGRRRVGKSRAAKLVRSADKVSNVRTVCSDPPDGWSIQRRRDYVEFCREIVGAARDASPELGAIFDQTATAALELLPP
jgi:hypothetical protein